MENSMTNQAYWRKCTTCKKPIGFGQKYWICSVSTCNRIRTDLVFCDVRCFDAHVPVMNHRDAGAYEKKAPMTAQVPLAASSRSGGSHSPRTMPAVSTPIKTGAISPVKAADVVSHDDILVVASKVKEYIRAKSGMSTSASVMELLSDRVRSFSDRCILNAEKAGRKTVLDRDVF
jgi:hypothetical protein